MQNALSALGAAWFVGADMDKAVQALAGFTAEKGRGARHELAIGEGSFTLIDESYNANPASMRAALSLMASSPTKGDGRRIAVLGDMLEMGKFAEKVHRELAPAITEAGTDVVCLAGPEMAHLADEIGEALPVTYRPNADEITAWLLDNIQAGDVVMIKSSFGIGFGGIVSALCKKFAPASVSVSAEVAT